MYNYFEMTSLFLLINESIFQGIIDTNMNYSNNINLLTLMNSQIFSIFILFLRFIG